MKAGPTPVNPLAGGRGELHGTEMANNDKGEHRDREERLAAALRENLRKRKAQARQAEQVKKPQS
jgi:hypothetical protein